MPKTSRTPLAAGIVVLSVAFGAAARADEQSLPERRAGLWELSNTMDEGMGPRESSMKLCVEKAMEANTVKASMAEHKSNCELYEIKKSADATTVDASCRFNGRHVTSRTEMSGDFQTAFKVTIESTTSDNAPNGARSIVVKRTIMQKGTYLGESCGEVAPGQAMAPDGTKVMTQ